MKKENNKRSRKEIIFNIVCIAAVTLSLLCTAFLFTNAINRIIESFRDLGLSVAYYFCEIFHINADIHVTVTELPSLNLFPTTGKATVDLPETWTGFKEGFAAYWQRWADIDNLKSYLVFLGKGLYNFSYILLMVMPIIAALYILFTYCSATENNDYGEETKPLIAFKRFTRFYSRVKAWVIDFTDFVKGHNKYLIAFLCIWAFNFNLFTIFVEFLAYYFYFCMSFDFSNIFRQIYKLACDIATPIAFIPWYIWLIIAFIVFDYIRKSIAKARLNHMERKNCGFINERPIVSMVVGTMGKGKTTMLTDMCLSAEVMFRDKAFEKLLENDLKFPYFPWINLENSLKHAIGMHEIYNLASCRKWVRKKYSRWNKNKCPEKLYCYDYERYGFTYNDKLNVVNIWQVIEIYVQLYFIYVMESSLLISNYSIRSDLILSDIGNFPMWNGDFFSRDSRLKEAYSRHAHILDFDMLRLGKTLVEENKQTNAFEFGVVAISEIGKERLNQLGTKEMKINSEDTNQKNDGFNDGLKMRRHSATVDNYSFIKIISDEQRPESLGADARDMFDVIYIKERGERKLAMPFFSLGELIYSFVYGKFCNFYSDFRYKRGDNTLLAYLIKSLAAKFNHYYTGIYNKYSYTPLAVQVENGTLDGIRKDGKYYLASKKIYSDRFSTDCMSAFWEEKALKSDIGLDDVSEYATSRASWEELKKQNSYFVRNTLLKGKTDKDENK